MRRVLLLVCLLAIAVSIAYFLRRSQSAPLPVADAPSTPRQVQAAGTESVDDTTAPAPTREQQLISAESSPAATAYDRVHGHVRFADTREPVAGAQVLIRYRDPADAAAAPKTSLAGTMPDGGYSAAVPTGSVLLEALVPERKQVVREDAQFGCYVDAFEPLAKDLELRELRGNFKLDLLLESGTCIQGIVLQASDRQPIAGAEVQFQTSHRLGFITKSRSDGRFTIRGIKFESPHPFARRLGSLLASHRDFVRIEQPLADPDELGHWPELTLLLERGLQVGGIVVDASGEPVSGLELSLRPMHGSPQSGLCEYEGEWKAKSDRSGIFRFEMVPAFDRAWLVTARTSTLRERFDAPSLAWHGPSRTLLRGKDPNLPSIDLHLPLEVSVEVAVRYPDGTSATPGECLLLREDEDGKLRAARDEGRFVCVAGRATRVVAWGKPRANDEKSVIYRGETVLTVGATGSDPHPEIRLAPTANERRELEPGERSMSRGAGAWTNTAITLQFVDRATGEPIPEERLLGIGEPNSYITSQIGKGARIRFYFEPGWVTLKLTVEGYQAYTIELEVKDNEPQTITLPLDRLP